MSSRFPRDEVLEKEDRTRWKKKKKKQPTRPATACYCRSSRMPRYWKLTSTIARLNHPLDLLFILMNDFGNPKEVKETNIFYCMFVFLLCFGRHAKQSHVVLFTYFSKRMSFVLPKCEKISRTSKLNRTCHCEAQNGGGGRAEDDTEIQYWWLKAFLFELSRWANTGLK